MQVFEVSVPELLRAAMRVCDLYGDSAQAREDMRVDVLATPPHLRADLLDHFTSLTRVTAEIPAIVLDDFDATPMGLEETA